MEDQTQIWAQDTYHFHGQRADEHVMMVKNQHWITLGPTVLWSIVSLLIPFILFRFIGGSFALYGLIIYGLWLLFFLGGRIYAYVSGICILSNQRIVNVQQKGFFHRQISEAELNRIQDVSSDIQGVWQTLFKFGHVTIRTASKDSLLILKNITDPYEVQQTIVRVLKESGHVHHSE